MNEQSQKLMDEVKELSITLPEKGEAVFGALAKAQKSFKEIKKNKTAGSGNFKYNYATLSEVIKSTQPALNANDLVVTQVLDFDVSNIYALITKLIHKDGSHIDSVYPLPNPSQKDPQQFGKIMTYARRYSYAAIVGVESEEDTDGAGSGNTPPANAKKTQSPATQQTSSNTLPNHAKVSEKQLKRLFAITNAEGWPHDDVKKLIKELTNLDSSKDLNKVQYDKICDYIQANDPLSAPE